MRNLIFTVVLVCAVAGLALSQTGTAPAPTSNPPAATDSSTPPTQTAPATTTPVPQPPQNQVPQADQPAPPSGTVLHPANVPETARGRDVPKGAEIKAALDTPLSSKTSKVGDRFTAT